VDDRQSARRRPVAVRGRGRPLILPVVTLGLFGVGPLARMTRASLLEALNSDYIRTARAAGLPRRQVIWVYAFRNALVPVLNTAGMVFSFLLGANVLVEKVFGWPGIGAYAIEALLASDFAPVQGFVIVMALFYVVVNLAIDVVTVMVDPRVSFDA
jgi:peptide/nickel transport system permease protein